MVIGVRKVWNIQWEHGLWTGIWLRNLYTWVGKAGKDPMAEWTQVLVMLSALECVILEAVWVFSVEWWEIWSSSFSTKEHPMVSCPAWHTLELVTFSPGSARPCSRAVPGERWDWWGEFPALVLLTEPNLPTTLPEHHLKICHDCQNRGGAITFSTGCVEFSQRILEFWLADWGKKDTQAWGMLVSSLPVQSCSWHSSGTPEPHGRCGDGRLRI